MHVIIGEYTLLRKTLVLVMCVYTCVLVCVYSVCTCVYCVYVGMHTCALSQRIKYTFYCKAHSGSESSQAP